MGKNRSFFLEHVGPWACSVCEHVRDGSEVKAVGNVGFTYTLGCCADCLRSDNRTTFRADHILGRQPDLIGLFHLPIYGQAVHDGAQWRLGRMDFDPEPDQIRGKVALIRSTEAFVETAETFFVLRGKRELYSSVFHDGARFVPVWTDRTQAEAKRRSNLLDWLLFKVDKLSAAQLISEASAQRHNYVAIAHPAQSWEAVIASDVLDLDENTMQL